MKRFLFLLAAAGLFASAATHAAYPARRIEVGAFWDERLGKLMKSGAWKKVLAQYGWADAYADSAQFLRNWWPSGR